MIGTVLFDIDGVLLDSLEANRKWYGDVLDHFGYIGPSESEMPTHHGWLAKDVLRKYAPGASESTLQKMMVYGDQMDSDPALLRVPKHAPEVIAELYRRCPLALVTNRTRLHTEELFQFYNKRWFCVHVVAEDTKKHKPDPTPLLLAAARLHVAPQECVCIGDMQSDVTAGHAAGMKVVLYAQHDVPGADARAGTFAEIPKILNTLD